LANRKYRNGSGFSVIICKSQRGWSILKTMKDKNLLILEKIDSTDIIQNQSNIIRRCK